MKASLLVVSMMLAMGLAGSGAGAETDRYPVKPIRMVVPFTPGGSNDLLGRVLAQKLHATWGQPAIVDNRPGGGSAIGTETVVRERLLTFGVVPLSGTPEALADYLQF